MKAKLLVLGISVAIPMIAEPQANQNPSPMVESTRAHQRLVERPYAGVVDSMAGPGGRRVDVFIPERASSAPVLDLLVHFHGAAWLARQSADSMPSATVVAVVNLGAGSTTYDRAFSDSTVFDSLVTELARVAALHTRHTRFRHVTLSGFSAGHGAIRAILRTARSFDDVDAVLLLDGMHTAYVPERRVLADSGTLDTLNLTAFEAFALAAIAGGKRFVVTHSEIFPGTFASTTETADWLLARLGVKRKAVLRWGPRGMQQLSEAGSGGFRVLGYAGNTAPDHIDHFHAMPELLSLLWRRD